MKPGVVVAIVAGAAAVAYLIYRQTRPVAVAPVQPTPTAPPSSGKPQPPARRDVPGRPPKPSDSDPRMVAAVAAYEAEKRASSGYFYKSRPMWAWRGTAWGIVQAV